MKLGGVEGDRDFAQVRLRASTPPALCWISSEAGEGVASGPDRTLGQRYYVMVATTEGIVLVYKMDPQLGGECRLDKEFVIHEARSQALGATVLS